MQTFIVRLWQPAAAREQAGSELRGFVHEVASGATHAFVGPDELAALLHDASGRQETDDADRGSA